MPHNFLLGTVQLNNRQVLNESKNWLAQVEKMLIGNWLITLFGIGI